PVDPRKAAVEAAIARAKARKAEQQAAPAETPSAEPMTTHAKRPSPRRSLAFRRAKQHSRQLTRNKWFSESQAPPIPITSGRPRALCCWCCSPPCLVL
ncbi:electron transport complex subunit RsxC, partial [Klebsiella quasipneumoniae]|nr:electron transport complex subunit RsxC [Klebsiella quasipneumoniae]